MPMVVPKRVQSVLSLCAILVCRLQMLYEAFENLAAVLVAGELVEAGAGRRQQDCIAGLRVRMREAHGVLQRFGMLQRHGAVKLCRYLGGGRADQQRGVRSEEHTSELQSP